VGGPVLFGPGAGITIELSDSFLVAVSAKRPGGACQGDGQLWM